VTDRARTITSPCWWWWF